MPSKKTAAGKKIDKPLAHQEDFFRRMMENARDLIYRYDFIPKRGFAYVSPSATAMTGFTPEEHYADPDLGFKLVHPEDRHLLKTAVRGEAPSAQSIVLRWVRKDGFVIWTEQHNTPIFNDEGNLIAIEGIARDITERKRAEEALNISEEKFRMVANFTYDWEAWRAPDGTYKYVSPSCERITEYKAEEFTANSKLMMEITHPDDRTIINDHLYKVANQSQKNDYQIDFRIITRSGEVRWVGHSCTAVYGENGQWLGRRESNRDITARKRDEIAVRSRLWLSKFADNHTIDQLLENTLNETEALTASENGFFHFLNADQKTIEMQAWSTNTLDNTHPEIGQHYPVDQAGLWANCVRTRMPVIENDYPNLPDLQRKGLPAGHPPLTRVLVAPIFYGEQIVAVIGVGNKPTNYDDIDAKSVSQMGHMVWEVILRKRAEKEVIDAKEALEIVNLELQAALVREQELSHTDSLTGINNRRYLYELAASAFNIAMRHQLPLTIMLFDIDHFKNVNDTYGHDIGDLVLQLVVQAARAELRSSDVIGRYGGEEFVIILPMTTAEQAYILAERIREGVAALRTPTPKGEALVTLSIGIAELTHEQRMKYPGGELETLDSLIRHADEAMYTAKQAGRNRVSVLTGNKH